MMSLPFASLQTFLLFVGHLWFKGLPFNAAGLDGGAVINIGLPARHVVQSSPQCRHSVGWQQCLLSKRLVDVELLQVDCATAYQPTGCNSIIFVFWFFSFFWNVLLKTTWRSRVIAGEYVTPESTTFFSHEHGRSLTVTWPQELNIFPCYSFLFLDISCVPHMRLQSYKGQNKTGQGGDSTMVFESSHYPCNAGSLHEQSQLHQGSDLHHPPQKHVWWHFGKGVVSKKVKLCGLYVQEN